MNDKSLRKHLINLLKGNLVHMPFDEAVSDFPVEFINVKPPNVPYTFWHLVEHLRITQWDILDFCRNPNYVYIKWPDDYWPKQYEKATEKDWEKSVKDFQGDFEEFLAIVKNPKNDLFKAFAWGEGQTLLREALLVADHNAYHVGELAILRQVTSSWPKGRES